MQPSTAGTNRPTRTLLFRPRKVPKARRDPELKRYLPIDRKLVKLAKKILILKSLQWPTRVKKEFLRGVAKGKPRLPEITYPELDLAHPKQALSKLMARCDPRHPVGNFLRSTAESYVLALTMVENRGTPAFTELSRQIYGHPADPIGWDELTHLSAADHFIASSKEMISSYCVSEQAYYLTPRYVAKRLRHALVPHFKDHKIKVLIDPTLPSKACAGGKRIRVRARTCFSEVDIGQLIHHEGFVHMLTKINGSEQPYLSSLGLASPRTTKTQEGLATFAELMTGTIDLNRLLRIALRTRAVNMAIEGADFIEVFRYFRETGQSDEESFHSAHRVFRGGDPQGGIACTKDVVYLQGLILTHTFFRKAVQRNKFYLAQHLFSGRLTLGDAIALEPFFASGYIKPPYYVPPWLVNRECFAAHLCYYVFANRITLTDVRLKDFFEM